MLEVNAPAVVAEIERLHDAYERALAANDVPALNGFFWDSPHIVRFGVNEHLYGTAAVAAYRQSHTPVFTDRKILRRTVTALGPDFASVMTELSQKIAGQSRHSRQSQVWARLPAIGWKVIAAHVSNPLVAPPASASWEAYVDQASAALGLVIAPEYRAGVVQNLQRAAAIAAPLLATPLPEDAEVASVFTP
jgi:ketosteroid isomerase-like protein